MHTAMLEAIFVGINCIVIIRIHKLHANYGYKPELGGYESSTAEK